MASDIRRMIHRLRIGARGSNLSLEQARLVRTALAAAVPSIAVEVVVIATTGDKLLDTPLPLLGGKGAFTEEIERALLAGEIDYAVHSLKDLPVQNTPGLETAAVLPRAQVADALIARSGETLATLPERATIGTSSPRRSAQLLRVRPDFQTRSIRGNVETRLRKTLDPAGPYDATILARAGLDRLGLMDAVSETLSLDDMLPAPGQGAIAVQCQPQTFAAEAAAAIDHAPSNLATAAERAFLAGLGGGCAAPIAAYGVIEDGTLRLRGRVVAIDGLAAVDVELLARCPSILSAVDAGLELAARALADDAALILGSRP